MDGFREIEELAFLRTGIIASTFANCHRDPSQNPTPFTPQDFMPTAERGLTREKTREEMEAEWLSEMRTVNARFGGVDLTNG